MQLAAARTILALPRDQDSWPYINANVETFIWDEHGLEVDEWNAMVGKNAGFEDVTASYSNPDEEHATFFSYKGKSVRVPLVFGREDNFISIHTLSQLVRKDSELRYCIDSTHSSDVAFLPLTPAQWRALEAEFGREAVAFRFLAIGPDLEAFSSLAFADENLRTYACEAEEATPVDTITQGIKEQIQLLAHMNYSCAAVHTTVILDKFLHLLITVDTDKQRDALRNNRTFKRQVDLLRAGWPADVALQSISFQSEQTIALNEGRFWTSLWWVDGACPALRWDRTPADYNARLQEMRADELEPPRPPPSAPQSVRAPDPVPPAPDPIGRPHPAESTRQAESKKPEESKKQEATFLSKHWLTIAFFSFFLAVYFFGKTLQ
ncbi:MAG: hypothetical protein V4857_16775 [Pseudomonadota bacterium]